MGISESLTTLRLPVTVAGPSVYGHASRNAALPKTGSSSVPLTASAGVGKAPEVLAAEPSKPIRVLCVDDSPVVLTLLKKILSSDPGFEVVGTAANGLEAAKAVKELKPDVMTLDIHMPEQTGLEYLEKNFRSGSHPSVVMVTSVSREDSGLAGKALSLGAMDYVEKPALSNLEERADEIRTKLRCAFWAGPSHKVSLSLDHSFQAKKTVLKPEEKLRVVVLPASYDQKLKKLVDEMTGPQPPCVLLVDGPEMLLEALAKKWSQSTGKVVKHCTQLPEKMNLNEIFIMDFKSVSSLHQKFESKLVTSLMIFGEVSKTVATELKKYKSAQFILEDLGKGTGTKALMDVASDVVLSTSFLYLSDEYFHLTESTHSSSLKKKVG